MAEETRPAQTPMANAGTATLSGMLSSAATVYVMTNHPELAPVAPLIGGAVQGALAGAGNKARTVSAAGDRSAPIRLVAWLLSWLS
jgi:hypothetical protein